MMRSRSDTELRRALSTEAPYLRRFARSLVSDPAVADDLVQDTLERAIGRLHLFDKSRDLRPWLFRILRNLNISQYRRIQQRGVHVALDTVSDAALPAGPVHDDGLMVRDISKALEMLAYEQREVLVLVALEGMKYREVVDVLGIPIGTVMSRLSRARERLRELLDYPAQKTIRRVK